MNFNQRCQPLLSVLRDPAHMATLDLKSWDLLLRQAGSAGLLSRIAVQAEAAGLNARVPDAVRPHLTAARTVAAKQRQAVRWEARRIAQALAETDAPVLLLKGAAYAIADLPPAAGRLFGDIDILVPHAQLGRVEGALLLAGWHTQKQDDYDQRYYRRWMHELTSITTYYPRPRASAHMPRPFWNPPRRWLIRLDSVFRRIPTSCCIPPAICSTKVNGAMACAIWSTWMPCCALFRTRWISGQPCSHARKSLTSADRCITR
jgi:hypothetical protein